MLKEEVVKLVGLCKQGDEKAFEMLYRSFYPWAYRYALSLTRCEADAHDATQEALIQAHENIQSLKSPELFQLWLRRIVFNQCTRLFRKNKHVIFNDTIISGMEGKLDSTMENNPDKLMRFHSDRDVMVYFFGMLPNGQREVMELFYFEQKTTKEIAAKTKLPEGTVKSRIFTAKKELRTKIKKYEKAENIALDFESNVLLGYLGQGSLFAFLGSSLQKLKSLFVSEAGKAVAILTLTSAIGVSGYTIYKQNESNVTPNTTTNSMNQNPAVIPQKAFSPTMIHNQEIKTAQDAYFKIILWSNNEEDFKAASIEECIELENMLTALKSYGGFYYELLEKNGWINNFYKFSKINERIIP